MDRGIDGRAGAAGEEEGPVQKTESGKFKLTHYRPEWSACERHCSYSQQPPRQSYWCWCHRHSSRRVRIFPDRSRC